MNAMKKITPAVPAPTISAPDPQVISLMIRKTSPGWRGTTRKQSISVRT